MRAATTTPHTPWPTVKLGDVCEEIRERISTDVISLETYITTDNMLKSCGGVRVAESLPPNTSLVRYKIGDVLLSNIRPYLKKLWRATCDGGCSSDVIVFRSSRGDLDSNYLYQVLSQEAFFDYVMQNVSGTKMPRGKREWIKDFTFPLPPLEVQREIVAKVEAGLKEADGLVAHFKRLAALADDTFKAELDETFSTLNAPTVKLGDVCKFVRGPFGGALKKEIFQLSGYAIYEQQHAIYQTLEIRYFIDTQKYEELKRFSVSPGEMIVSCSGTIGKTFVIPPNAPQGIINQALLKLTPYEWVDIFYLQYFFNNTISRELNNISRGGAIKNVPPVSELKTIPIPLPSLDIQRAIVARLEGVKARCEQLKGWAERGLKAAEALRKAVLAEAFEQ